MGNLFISDDNGQNVLFVKPYKIEPLADSNKKSIIKSITQKKADSDFKRL